MVIAHSKLAFRVKKNFLLSAGSTGVVGELLHDKEITGHPVADLAIKVILPLISGVIAPLIQEWIETRKHRRQERKKKQSQPK